MILRQKTCFDVSRRWRSPKTASFTQDGEIISQFDAVIDFSPKGGPKRLAARFKLLSGGRLCGNQPVPGYTRRFFTKSFLDDDAAVLA